jgi:hypothetical protein
MRRHFPRQAPVEGLEQRIKSQLLEEVLDPQKVTLLCGDHNYVSGSVVPPTAGCSKCWLVYFVTEVGKTPPDKRHDKVEMLEQMVRHMIESEKTGDNMKLFEHPEVKVEREN